MDIPGEPNLNGPSAMLSPEEQVMEMVRRQNKGMMGGFSPPNTGNALKDFLMQIPTALMGMGARMPGHQITNMPTDTFGVKTAPEIFNKIRNEGLEPPANIDHPKVPFGKSTNYRFDPNFIMPEMKPLEQLNAEANKRHYMDLLDMARHSDNPNIENLLKVLQDMKNKGPDKK